MDTHRNNETSAKPRDIHERLLDFACDIVRAAQFLQTRGAVARALSYQVLNAGTSVGANAQEADGASSRNDFIAKFRISLKEAKEVRFRLKVCRRCELLDAGFDGLLNESDELVRIIASIVHNALRNRPRNQSEDRGLPGIGHWALSIEH